MNVNLDSEHNKQVAAALADGAAADAQSYIESLIEDDAANRFLTKNRGQLASLLRKRMAGPFTSAANSIEELQANVDSASRELKQS